MSFVASVMELTKFLLGQLCCQSLHTIKLQLQGEVTHSVLISLLPERLLQSPPFLLTVLSISPGTHQTHP